VQQHWTFAILNSPSQGRSECAHSSSPVTSKEMLGLNSNNGSKPKCYFTSTRLPLYVNHEQPSTKSKPFSIIAKHNFSHTVSCRATNMCIHEMNG
jgi:hypothetical protein